MIRTLCFIFSAWFHGHAYIDLDGCLLHRMPVPNCIPRYDRLRWWIDNLRPTPIVKSRLALLYMLRALGVRLFVWTNRRPTHDVVTRIALGRHVTLFDEFYYCDGLKKEGILYGPVMDDQPEYIPCGSRGSLLVKQL